jgi:transcriptional regulator with XRE-family HTH domain
MDFREAMRRVIFEFRLVQKELGRLSGVHPNNISAFCRGGRSLSLENFQAVFRVLSLEQQRYFFALVTGDVELAGDLPVPVIRQVGNQDPKVNFEEDVCESR